MIAPVNPELVCTEKLLNKTLVCGATLQLSNPAPSCVTTFVTPAQAIVAALAAALMKTAATPIPSMHLRFLFI
jgi:hypothetical protein